MDPPLANCVPMPVQSSTELPDGSVRPSREEADDLLQRGVVGAGRARARTRRRSSARSRRTDRRLPSNRRARGSCRRRRRSRPSSWRGSAQLSSRSGVGAADAGTAVPTRAPPRRRSRRRRPVARPTVPSSHPDHRTVLHLCTTPPSTGAPDATATCRPGSARVSSRAWPDCRTPRRRCCRAAACTTTRPSVEYVHVVAPASAW